MTTEDLEVGSNRPHHKATSSQRSRRNPSNSGLVLGNGALHSENRKTNCGAGLGKCRALAPVARTGAMTTKTIMLLVAW